LSVNQFLSLLYGVFAALHEIEQNFAQICMVDNDYNFELTCTKNRGFSARSRRHQARRITMDGNRSHHELPQPPEDLGKGSQSAAQCFWEHRGWMTSVLAARTRGRWDVAEELWAELAANLVEKPESLNGVQHVRSWLYRLAFNRAADWVRSQQRNGQRFSSAGSERLAGDLVTSADLPPLEVLLGAERGADLQDTFARLEDEDQEILYLKYLHGWNYTQIGEHLSLTAHQVTHRLRLARQRLKLALLQSPLAEEYSAEYHLGTQGVRND
jgi:RNA polymerase sigma factor (sigma-70 family)